MTETIPNTKKRLATIWLDGCSGCHMSFLDLDERLLELTSQMELVYSPLVDRKDFPDHVDVTLVEGSVSSEEDLHKIKLVREHTGLLVSLGDCAVTGNVPSLRNPIGPEAVIQRVYLENNLLNPQVPNQVIPKLLPLVRPVHAVVKVDLYVPGCPPSADVIYYVLSEVLAGRMPDLSGLTRFGK
ncbi:MAG: NADP oxidoreductase [Chloroflexota bacterium]